MARDPHGSVTIAYVPPGSLSRGKELVTMGGPGEDRCVHGLPWRVAQRECAGRCAANRGASTDLYLPPAV